VELNVNTPRLYLTIIVVFIVANLTGFFVHGVWLKQDYLPVASMYRPDSEIKIVFIVLGYLAFAIGSVWLYAHGVEDKPRLGQGLRFGIALWLVLAIPSFFIAYAVQPVPLILMVKQVLSEGVNKILLGLIIAILYRR
jgi:hypothetical protein